MSATTQTLPQQPPTSPTKWAPTAKVSVGILAASLTTLLLPLLSKMHISPDASQAAALTTLITFAIQYVVPER
jgi:hypothetical protein